MAITEGCGGFELKLTSDTDQNHSESNSDFIKKLFIIQYVNYEK